MNAKGKVFKYGDNVDTDVIIPARYLNIADPKELSTHCNGGHRRGFRQEYAPGRHRCCDPQLRLRFFP